MLFSKAFIPTLREDPAEADTLSHRLLLRGGFIRKVSSGIYEWLPLGLRVLKKIEGIVREEMNAIGGLEVWLPVVQPKELWLASGRWEKYGKELLRFKDRKDAEFCLAPTAEEVVTTLVAGAVGSYRSLPLMLYQFCTKFRDEIRPRFGIMRGREFYMKDAYSFHHDEADAERYYQEVHQSYCKIFDRLGLSYRSVEADTGPIGGSFSHEFMVLSERGEDQIVHCTHCDYAANLERAESSPEDSALSESKIPNPQDVATPGLYSVDDVSQYLKIPKERFIKTLFYWSDATKPIVCLLRGDHELNEAKLRRALGCEELIKMKEKEYEALCGAPVGFAGPQGLKTKVKASHPSAVVLADNAVRGLMDGVSGANRKDFHTLHLSYGRDFEVDEFADLHRVLQGERCPRCPKGALVFQRGIEVGQVFKLGTKYAKPLNALYLDAQGQSHPMVMGCYGIGVSRIVAAAVEQNADQNGMIWPRSIAPYEIIVICVEAEDTNVFKTAQDVYEKLARLGFEVLMDERSERAGVKFKDADLIGIPLRITVSARSLSKGGVEMKLRNTKEPKIIPLDQVMAAAKQAREWLNQWHCHASEIAA